MKKNNVLTVIIILISICLSLFAYSYTVDTKEVVEFMEATEPTLPTIEFHVEGYLANELMGYVDEIDITTTRDTLTPLDSRGFLNFQINSYKNKIQKISYQVTTLEGKTLLLSGESEMTEDNQYTINLNAGATAIAETVLKITLELEHNTVDYYTRIIAYDQLMLRENLNFIEECQSLIIKQDQDSEVLQKYFTGEGASSQNYHTVTQDSILSDVLWGALKPQIIGDIKWKILDSTSVFTWVELSYLAQTTVDGNHNYYKVTEFYRTGYSTANKSVNLTQYKRTLNQYFLPNQQDLGYKTVALGIRNEEVQYKESDNIEHIVFTQEKELWTYHTTSNEFVKIFSFHLSNQNIEYRALNDNHDIHILDVEDNGNVTFTVYGYMNSGIHEGQVGTAIYYYDHALQAIKEMAFVQSQQAYAVARESLSHGIYYSKELECVYVVAEGAIHVVDLVTFAQEKLTENLESNQYSISLGGNMLAYNSGKDNLNTRVTVLNIGTGETYNIKALDGEEIYPLGFLDEDVICGYTKESDKKLDQLGIEIQPYHTLEIRDPDNVIIKTYTQSGSYISHIEVEDRMLIMHQVQLKSGMYVTADTDYISNNIEQSTARVEATYLIDGIEEKQQVLKLPKQVPDIKLNIIQSKTIYNKDVLEISYGKGEIQNQYYVYAYGEMLAVFKDLGQAIPLASDNYGAVIDDNQAYVWRRSARALRYNSDMETVWKSKLNSGISPLEIVTFSAGPNIETYTGATVEQMCYLINKGQIIALELQDGSWGVFVGYDGDTIYYLDQSGKRISSFMTKLDTKIKSLIGTAKF